MRESLSRRLLLQLFGASTASAVAGCADDPGTSDTNDATASTFEYIVVGSGAGGGPLAANLARNGHSVLLLEAGTDRGDSTNYQVPAFHPKSTEDATMRWDYFVKHYSDPARQKQDSKARADGILYPRAGTLGGCTAHNAMITVYPHEDDWNYIAQVTGDASWSAANMRRYFEILERCEYMSSKDAGAKGHGFSGWLKTHLPDPLLALGDLKLIKIITAAALAFDVSKLLGFPKSQLLSLLKRDLNARGPQRDQTEGMFLIPMHTDGKKRVGPRELILKTVADGYPLTVRTNALVSRVIFATAKENGKRRATGVEYLAGEHLYRADPNAKSAGPGTTKTVKATREVILAAGAFNTPQLLKLSGVGPKAELAKHNIKLVVDLPGVGTNLQDRYEVGVVSEMASDIRVLEDCTFNEPGKTDPCLTSWKSGDGVYTSNGGVVGLVRRSTDDKYLPDLFVFGLPGYFKGYEPGYSKRTTQDKQHFTWAVLKAHTGNTAGSVTLRTTDPRDVPEINFRYFDEGSTDKDQDIDDLYSVVEGVKFARSIGKTTDLLMTLSGGYEEVFPGPDVETDEEIADFVRKEAWGHHASCTCKIGADSDPTAVLDSQFRVRGTLGLRVVDASVFPKIPGFFIVAPIYMISEKATDVLLADLGETRKP